MVLFHHKICCKTLVITVAYDHAVGQDLVGLVVVNSSGSCPSRGSWNASNHCTQTQVMIPASWNPGLAVTLLAWWSVQGQTKQDPGDTFTEGLGPHGPVMWIQTSTED